MAETRVRSFIMLPHEARAATEGRLTQIRRIARNIEAAPHFRAGWKAVVNNRRNAVSAISIDAPGKALGAACPFGQPGDLLYGREAWRRFECCGCSDHCSCPPSGAPDYRALCESDEIDGWRSPVTMPRWASRFTLEVTDVRVQRVQDMTHEDGLAAGISPLRCYGDEYNSNAANWYSGLFASIYGREAWDANPWTWVARVRVHQKNIDEYLREAA